MDDLIYIVTLGFSGSDIWRAIIISFFAAMLVTSRRRVWLVAFWALFIDRFVWPLSAMSSHGADMEMLGTTASAIVTTLPDDMGLYLIRYIGLFVMISVYVAARRRLHAPWTEKPTAKPA